MAKVEVTLDRGLNLEEKPQLLAVVQTTTAGNVMDASEDAERLMATSEGYQLVPSPSALGMHLLRRQIVKVGDIEGPLTLGQLRLLSSHDLELLNIAAQALDASTGVAQRGRDESARPRGGAPGESGQHEDRVDTDRVDDPDARPAAESA